MASSHQIPIVLPTANGEDDHYYEQTAHTISNIKVAKIEKLQDRFPELKKFRPNHFVRTRIDFPYHPQNQLPANKRAAVNNIVAAQQDNNNPTSPNTNANNSTATNTNSAAYTTSIAQQSALVDNNNTYISYNKYVSDDEVVLLNIVRSGSSENSTALAFPRAGPRKQIPARKQIACILCPGSLCPGQNDVIAEIFNCLYYNYGVDTIYGIVGGFRGFYEPENQPWQVLTPQEINDCVGQGGCILGSSRGGFDVAKIVNACQVYCVTQMYLIGGDGSHYAASEIDKYCKEHNIMMSTACVPCSIENDLAVIDSSFGFGSALSGALDAIQSAVTESRCAPNGVGIVAVTGKHSGYLACHSVLASNNVCACLIPEAPFSLYGPDGLLEYVYKVVQRMSYAVIVVAEGTAKSLLHNEDNRVVYKNSTNNPLYNGEDCQQQDTCEYGYDPQVSPSEWIREEISKYFKFKRESATVRLISASTTCRSAPANPSDRVHCLSLSNNAVHAAMYGYTAFSSAIVNNRSVLIPANIISRASPSALSLDGRTFERVVTLTQQPKWSNFDEQTRESAEIFRCGKLPATITTRAKL